MMDSAYIHIIQHRLDIFLFLVREFGGEVFDFFVDAEAGGCFFFGEGDHDV